MELIWLLQIISFALCQIDLTIRGDRVGCLTLMLYVQSTELSLFIELDFFYLVSGFAFANDYRRKGKIWQ